MTPQAQICINALREGRKILICGNGGSASMASHFAAEIVVRFAKDRQALPCISLASDQSVITACANDFGFETIFERQVQAFGKVGDVLIALSTSGKSRNVILAIRAAQQIGMHVIVPSHQRLTTASRQEEHLEWLHDLAREIEESFV